MTHPGPTHPRRRRLHALGVVALLLVATVASACGSDSDGASPSTTAATGEGTTTEAGGTGDDTGDAGDADGDPFPVTVEHEYGSTEIPEKPERVVSVGYTEQDMLLALGIIPVGITDWYGDQPYGTWPWAQEALGDAEPELLSNADGFQFERIAALEPDLIIGTNAGMEQEDYDQLSAIAPTVAQPGGAEGYFSRWDEQSVLIGKAVGMEAEAQELVDGVKQQFADAKAAHPEWEGTKVIFLQNAFYDGEAIAYQDGLSTEFLTDLGFVVPEELNDFLGEEEGSQAYIPIEQLPVLDAADVLIWGTEKEEDRAALEEEPLYNNLEEVKDGRLIFTDGLTAGAIYFTSVLSLPFVLEYLVPAFESTLDDQGPFTIDSY